MMTHLEVLRRERRRVVRPLLPQQLEERAHQRLQLVTRTEVVPSGRRRRRRIGCAHRCRRARRAPAAAATTGRYFGAVGAAARPDHQVHDPRPGAACPPQASPARLDGALGLAVYAAS